jgi:hypothetical protein
MKSSELLRQKFLLLIQWQFRFGHPISYQIKHMRLLAGMMGRRYVFYDIESWGLDSNHLDPNLSSRTGKYSTGVRLLGEQG